MLRTLGKVVPVCFVLGASMELFMVKTGFYDIGKDLCLYLWVWFLLCELAVSFSLYLS